MHHADTYSAGAGLGYSRFARHYSGNLFDFFSCRYWDVSLPYVVFYHPTSESEDSAFKWWSASSHLQGFPHSEIRGSQDICSYPRLIAAYHVFHRLLAPRHSPYTLVAWPYSLIRQIFIYLNWSFQMLDIAIYIFTMITINFSVNCVLIA